MDNQQIAHAYWPAGDQPVSDHQRVTQQAGQSQGDDRQRHSQAGEKAGWAGQAADKCDAAQAGDDDQERDDYALRIKLIVHNSLLSIL